MSASQSGHKRPLLRSCEACRASKIRCELDDVPNSKCQRCERLRKTCVFSESKARARKNGTNARRVLELEDKIVCPINVKCKADSTSLCCYAFGALL